MIQLLLQDARNHLFLTGFGLPTAFPSATGVSRHAGPQGDPVPDDESVGQLLTVMAKQRAAPWLRRIGRTTESDDAGLQTWVLSSSPRGAGQLEDWFRHARSSNRYRVLVHRTPRRYGGCALPALWDEVYNELNASGASALRQHTVADRALRSGVTALGNGLGAYPRGAEAVMSWADGLGHPYTLIV